MLDVEYKGVEYAFKMNCNLLSACTESLMGDNAYLQVKRLSLTVLDKVHDKFTSLAASSHSER